MNYAPSSDQLAWKVLVLMGALNLFRGSVHTFLPDGGAGVIAGFDLTHSFQLIVFLFAWKGIDQLALGVVDFLVAFRARAMAVPLLWFHALEQTAGIVIERFKPPPGRPPGVVGALFSFVMLWAALGWIYWQRRRAGRTVCETQTSSAAEITG